MNVFWTTGGLSVPTIRCTSQLPCGCESIQHLAAIQHSLHTSETLSTCMVQLRCTAQSCPPEKTGSRAVVLQVKDLSWDNSMSCQARATPWEVKLLFACCSARHTQYMLLWKQRVSRRSHCRGKEVLMENKVRRSGEQLSKLALFVIQGILQWALLAKWAGERESLNHGIAGDGRDLKRSWNLTPLLKQVPYCRLHR